MTKIIAFFLLLLCVAANAQSHEDFYQRTTQINRSGMYFLGGWAAANMAVGGYGWWRYEGEQKYFHQMNLAWNLVNAGIVAYALFDMGRQDISSWSDEEMWQKHRRSENIYLINAGLDILYMAGGVWMLHAASSNHKHRELLKGYGQSVIMQGAFLFLFDLAKFGLQYRHRQNFLQGSAANLSLSPQGVSLSISL